MGFVQLLYGLVLTTPIYCHRSNAFMSSSARTNLAEEDSSEDTPLEPRAESRRADHLVNKTIAVWQVYYYHQTLLAT